MMMVLYTLTLTIFGVAVSLQIHKSPLRQNRRLLTSMLSESIRLENAFGLIPLCNEVSKTTVVNDPTAGMTPEEQIAYLSNVGGGE